MLVWKEWIKLNKINILDGHDNPPFCRYMPKQLPPIPKRQPQQNNAKHNPCHSTKHTSKSPMSKPRGNGIRECKTKDILQTDDKKHEICGDRVVTIDHYEISLRKGWQYRRPLRLLGDSRVRKRSNRLRWTEEARKLHVQHQIRT